MDKLADESEAEVIARSPQTTKQSIITTSDCRRLLRRPMNVGLLAMTDAKKTNPSLSDGIIYIGLGICFRDHFRAGGV